MIGLPKKSPHKGSMGTNQNARTKKVSMSTIESPQTNIYAISRMSYREACLQTLVQGSSIAQRCHVISSLKHVYWN